MKLYLTPGACSLADHIALTEAGIDVEAIRVDLQTRRTEHGDDFAAVNPKGYVPALVLDDGEVLTENVAILDWVAGEAPHLAPEGRLGRSRNIEMLAFLATEIHRPFMRSMFSPAEAEKQAARQAIGERLTLRRAPQRGVYLRLAGLCERDRPREVHA
jgi:glutathione S-transferase